MNAKHIQVDSTRPELVGTKQNIDGWTVEFVSRGGEIQHYKWTSGYVKPRARPWVIRGTTKSFATIQNALAAIAKAKGE